MAIIRIKRIPGSTGGDHYHKCGGCGATSAYEDCVEDAVDCVNIQCYACTQRTRRANYA